MPEFSVFLDLNFSEQFEAVVLEIGIKVEL